MKDSLRLGPVRADEAFSAGHSLQAMPGWIPGSALSPGEENGETRPI